MVDLLGVGFGLTVGVGSAAIVVATIVALIRSTG